MRFLRSLLMLLLCLIATETGAQNRHVTKTKRVGEVSLVNKFYLAAGKQLFWYDTLIARGSLRARISEIIDSAEYYGLKSADYPLPGMNTVGVSTEQLVRSDTLFTSSVIRFATDIFMGSHISDYISNDEISGVYKATADSFVLAWLLGLANCGDLHAYCASLEPGDNLYAVFKKELRHQIDSGNTRKAKELAVSISLYRWIKHFHFDKYIVVNIPSAALSLYDHDTIRLTAKVVVGKYSTRTPRLATWCNKVILYPYWNVPASIARKELLPLFKRSLAKIGEMNMQVLNSNGKVVDPASLDWAAFNRRYFPYTIRQCTGCDNSLGVIKFNLTDPFDVYMHDTNYKLAFLSDNRYLSHGCIRVSNPIELGNCLLDNKLDAGFLTACIKQQEPVELKLRAAVPVFVVYMTAAVEGDCVKYGKDIYHLLK